MDGPTAVAAVLIASFAIDRIVSGSLFLLSYINLWARFFPDPLLLADSSERIKAEKKQKLVYFVFALILAVGVLAGLAQVRVFTKLGFTDTTTAQKILDIALTAIVLVAGADRLAALMALGGGSSATKASSQPIEITGTLVVEQGHGKDTKGGE